MTQLRDQGFNCAQTVLGSCCEELGLPLEQALALMGGFGGGCGKGEICGALSGAIAAIGLAKPHNLPGDRKAKEEIRQTAAETVDAFRAEFGCVTCRELLEKYGGREHCGAFIAAAVETIGKILEKE